MLKSIAPQISPELMKVMMEMGHGDTIMFADSNCGVSGYNIPHIRLDGVRIPELLEAILPYFPLEDSMPSVLVCEDEKPLEIWKTYEQVIRASEEGAKLGEGIQVTPGEQFLEEAMNCKCLVATGETALNANIILRKGVVLYSN